MANDEIQNLLRTGIQAAQSGNKAVARRILEQVIEEDPNNELAWMWMASVVESATERRACLQKVLEINPGNTRAEQALQRLAQVKTSPRPSPTPVHVSKEEAAAARDLLVPPLPELDREALLSGPPGRRRRKSRLPLPLFLAIGLLAITMIVVGVLLLVDSLMNADDDSAPAVAEDGATSTRQIPPTGMTPQVPANATRTPPGGIAITIPPYRTEHPTWTPQPTQTSPPTPTLAPTQVPLTTYTLLVSGKRDGKAEWELYTVAADGAQEKRVDMDLAATSDEHGLTLLEVYDASFSPDGEQIAFTARVRGVRTDGDTTSPAEFEEIFIAQADGEQISRLTTLEADHAEGAVWSPTGKHIAFASDADGDYDIYIVGVDDGNVQPLTYNDDEERDPTWAPDGQQIAFASDRSSPGLLEIWRMTIDGTEVEQLTDHVNSSYAPAWSPDGDWIAFVSNREVDTDLYMMHIGGLGVGVQRLPVGEGQSEERDPAWSADGQWIAFSSNWDSTVFEMYLIRPDGSAVQRATFEEGDTRFATWRP